ncbi:MAG: DUF1622 domain-containing protein [Leptospiraceae bacterium]|nr:DUF1622 domain-containing protein [Leptospiraceae bacterium]
MHEALHAIESGLGSFVGYAKVLLEGISAICVVTGLIASIGVGIGGYRRERRVAAEGIRLKFGSWLAIALEFQLGADILSTTVAPTMDALIKLAILAAIRTFLNFFLQKELEHVEKRGKEQ